jgi:hypothetical protein
VTPIKPFLSATLSFVVLFSLILATTAAKGCGGSKKDTLAAAIDASYRLPAATNDLIADINAGKAQNLISPEQARKFGADLNVLANAEVVFVQMVKAAEATFKATGSIDPATQRSLRDFFDASLVAPFLNVLQNAKVLSATDSALILAGVTAVRLLLHTIAPPIGSTKQNSLAGPGGVSYYSNDSGRLRAAFA